MSKQSEKKEVQSVDMSIADAATAGPEMLEAVNKLAETYGFQGTLTTKERRSSLNAWFSQTYIEAVAARYDAQQAIIGGDFDTAQMRQALTFVSSYEAAATAARTLARAIEDQILQQKQAVTLEANAICSAMKGKAKTAKGKALRGDVASLAALRKRGPRKPSTKTQPAQPVAPESTASEPSPNVAPAK